MIKPIKAESLKDKFIRQFEENILSGFFSIGERLPSERDLAAQMGVSRPVVHEGLVDLAAKGLVTMKPRHGTVVNDYRKEGSLALLQSLMEYKKSEAGEDILNSLLAMRKLFEIENVKLAALNRKNEHIEALKEIIELEKKVSKKDITSIFELDYNFHHNITIASGNMIYPLLMNSMKQLYTSYTAVFFKNKNVVPLVFEYHASIYNAVKEKDEKKAEYLMTELLVHGEEYLRNQIL